MNREEAYNLLRQNLTNQNLIKHSLALEAAMAALAARLGGDEEKWGVTGLLHDIDYELVKDNLENHSKKGAAMLKDLGLEEDICKAVLTHNESHGVEPETMMAKALFCADPLTGLIVAATLVMPSRKIKDLETDNVLNRFKEKAFARGANREIIAKCSDYLNLSLEEFVKIVLSAMKGISDDLGL
jgi:putative nucleotidyltransferase with HDIG domain